MENDNLEELVEEELILYLNSRSLQRLEIPRLGIIEKLTSHYWISEEFGLIPRIDIFSKWWGDEIGKQTRHGQCSEELFSGEKCLVNFRSDGRWMYGTTYLMKSYCSDYYVLMPEPRYSLTYNKERSGSGTLRLDNEILRAVISFRDPDKFEKIIKNIEE